MTDEIESNSYNLTDTELQINEMQKQLHDVSKNLRKLIYIYNNGSLCIKVFKEFDPKTPEIKYWLEQGEFLGTTTFNTKTINLIIGYKDTNFNILSTLLSTSNADAIRFKIISNTEIQVSRAGSVNVSGWYKTEGYTTAEILKELGII